MKIFGVESRLDDRKRLVWDLSDDLTVWADHDTVFVIPGKTGLHIRVGDNTQTQFVPCENPERLTIGDDPELAKVIEVFVIDLLRFRQTSARKQLNSLRAPAARILDIDVGFDPTHDINANHGESNGWTVVLGGVEGDPPWQWRTVIADVAYWTRFDSGQNMHFRMSVEGTHSTVDSECRGALRMMRDAIQERLGENDFHFAKFFDAKAEWSVATFLSLIHI